MAALKNGSIKNPAKSFRNVKVEGLSQAFSAVYKTSTFAEIIPYGGVSLTEDVCHEILSARLEPMFITRNRLISTMSASMLSRGMRPACGF